MISTAHTHLGHTYITFSIKIKLSTCPETTPVRQCVYIVRLVHIQNFNFPLHSTPEI